MRRIQNSRYTVELGILAEDPNFNIFNFDYDFYTDDETIRKKFEKKFIDHYYFYEIGCEPVRRWQKMLQTKLNTIMPLYKQIWDLEVRCKDIDFMLNKDLEESFSREIEGNNTSTNNSNSTSKNTSNTDASSTNDYKESNLDNGLAELREGYETSMSNASNSNNENSTSNSENKLDNTSNSNNKLLEKTTLSSKGNIGVTSAGELKEKAIRTMINIDEKLINECRGLFMLVY